MQRWEHARLIAKVTGEKRFIRLTRHGPGGTQGGVAMFFPTVREHDMNKDPEQWQEMDRIIAGLGADGWEMVSMTQARVGPSPEDDEWHYWFKRPYREE